MPNLEPSHHHNQHQLQSSKQQQDVGSWDSVLIENLSEDAFISNLHQRYRRDFIYTYIGTYLVAINPFRTSSFAPDLIQTYGSKGLFQLPPHIYGVANLAYQWLQDRNENQCVALLGESGAGKTETGHMVVDFITRVSEAQKAKRARRRSPAAANIAASSSMQRASSMDADRNTIKKSTHERTVGFDFSHHKSTDNLAANRCPKSSTSSVNSSTLPKQCLRHNHIGGDTTPINRQLVGGSCLKKSTNCLVDLHSGISRSNSRLADYSKMNSVSEPQCSPSPVASRRCCEHCAKPIIRQRHEQTLLLVPKQKLQSSKCMCSSSSSSMGGSREIYGILSKSPDRTSNQLRISISEELPEMGCRIRDRIVQAEVFLEAMGNAQTAKNFNSSRFGKFFDIEFDFKGDPIAGHLSHYMLEKSRITNTNTVGRNFHIFYQLISGADIQFLKSLKLQRNIDKYDLLKHGNSTEEDKNNFIYSKRSLEILGLNADEVLSVFKILSTIIKLGNLIYVPATNIDGTEGCEIANEYELLEISTLLNLDAPVLASCLTKCNGDWAEAADHGVDYSAVYANRIKLILCRTLYGRLFTWIVNRVNDSIKGRNVTTGRGKCIGILDFYGFETLDGKSCSDTANSFEQLAINYCNERLHQHFLQSVLRLRQDLFAREGLEWSRIDFFDNGSICDLIDGTSYGVLSILDEPRIICGDSLLARLRQCCAGHPNFLSQDTTLPPKCFQIRHFAGQVLYSVNGFLEKNCDNLPRSISTALYQSKLPIVQSLFPEGNPKRAPRKPTSVAASLRMQLQTLLASLEHRNCHYVFCIKPNEHKKPKTFELALVQHQIRYMSLMPLVTMWRTGHCFHMVHAKFLQRYKMLNRRTWPHFVMDASVVEGIAIVIRGLPLPAAEFTIGSRMVFIRSPRTVFELEELRRTRLHDLATLIQKTFRGYATRKWFLRLRNSQIVIASAWRTWRECRFGVPFAGRRHLWGIYSAAREEFRIIKYRKQVEWAVALIERQYMQFKKRHFLLTLPVRLPHDSLSPMCMDWPAAPTFLAETSQLLRNIYHRWRCYRYRKSFDQTSRNRMREKVTASIIFRDRKASYARSVAHPFHGDYVRLRQNIQWKKISVETNDQYVVFADIINKITRSSGKFVPILMVLSTSSMLLLDQRTLQVKYRIPASEIYRLSLSPYVDDIAVFHVKADENRWHDTSLDSDVGCMFQSEMGRKKGDFVFQTCHVIEIVTKMFLVVQNASSKPPEVHISTDFEANFGAQTVIFTFKCGSAGAMQMDASSNPLIASTSALAPPKVTRKGNKMEIIV